MSNNYYYDRYYPNRTLCDVFEEMRKFCKSLNFAPIPGLIEEAQMMANKMEAALYDMRDWESMKEEMSELNKKIMATTKELNNNKRDDICEDKNNLKCNFLNNSKYDFVVSADTARKLYECGWNSPTMFCWKEVQITEDYVIVDMLGLADREQWGIHDKDFADNVIRNTYYAPMSREIELPVSFKILKITNKSTYDITFTFEIDGFFQEEKFLDCFNEAEAKAKVWIFLSKGNLL